MRKWLFRLFWIPAFLAVLTFFVANRQLVSISLDPFNADNPALASPAFPLWLWLMLMLFIGVGLGTIGMWASGAAARKLAKSEHRELKTLKRDYAAATERLRAQERLIETGAEVADQPVANLEKIAS
ncbi:MAG: hypothetical protein AAGC77_12640 [Pseudomonadota bacterium]